MCKCHEEGFNCEQGKLCPARMPVQFAGDEPYSLKDLVIVAAILFILGYIAFRPELTGLVMAIGEMI